MTEQAQSDRLTSGTDPETRSTLNRRGRPRRARLLVGALGLAMIAVPLAVAWFLSLHAPVALGELKPKETPVVAPVVMASTDYDAAASLTVQ